MEHIHIKNLEKYHPGYKDGRKLLWIRWDIDAMNDYKISKLTPSQRWLFIGLICLELRSQQEVPNDEEWLSTILNHPKQSIHKDLLMLQTLDMVVTNISNVCHLQTYIQTDIQTVVTDPCISYDFESIWSVYPSKIGKRDAEKHFRSSVKTDKDFSDIQTALDNYKKSDRVKKGYIQNGGRWFLHWRDWVSFKEGESQNNWGEGGKL